eukprot:TRINITY_DN23706_c0_g1_i1.p1 TRINITY_DN23706_c0_g1~~TRINITY_DN23706_c0_g1_i1.p1  ORF type:complete len:518 (-),score=83.31 TRINITY_DN23706_c0_g1_i1:122-1675(-)
MPQANWRVFDWTQIRYRCFLPLALLTWSDVWRSGAAFGEPLQDCDLDAPGCLQTLNASSADDLVQESEVMDAVNRVTVDRLRDASLTCDAWAKRFEENYCEGVAETVAFPKKAKDMEKLRKLIKDKSSQNSLPVVLVHPEELTDGIGARFKKALEAVAAGLYIGFEGVGLYIRPGIHPEDEQWSHGPVLCHESPATSLPGKNNFPLICWKFELMSDLWGQSVEPEGSTPIWGLSSIAPLSAGKAGANNAGKSTATRQRFNCVRFGEMKEGDVWNFLRKQRALDGKVNALPFMQRMFASAHSFAPAAARLPMRREVLCGFGGSPRTKHVALHLRRGDVGESLPYQGKAFPGSEYLPRWLCALGDALGAGKGQIMVHIFTEAHGMSRRKFKRIPGVRFPPSDGDDVEPTFHARGLLDPVAACPAVRPDVHVVVNNNPREALLCMARADVLLTSLSSLPWTSAVFNNGVVFHPSRKGKSQTTHWDLRDQYMDWAENWFYEDDVFSRQSDIAAFFAKSHEL